MSQPVVTVFCQCDMMTRKKSAAKPFQGDFLMFGTRRTLEMKGKLVALDKSQAVIEFALDGTILAANANFLKVMGYTWGEIQGRHHSMFVEPQFKDSADYARFWEALRRGEFQAAQFKRIGKGGRRSGSRRPTTRFATTTAARSRW
ncbi:PAS domain-containing protein [Nitrospirillum sp. BR 11828]|uniref:PAS domain-containing protein n=1 Tax=Nitrospirillum sp. BR 11828 TaxID=3104325 RepID=UPI002ACA7219|nr:PAS domain-containing protein [Nitrospirillum sp. BR 11828]MDZ5647756.1 PAS domain-containing protein [Nitrospirillum sp. BR 11828]